MGCPQPSQLNLAGLKIQGLLWTGPRSHFALRRSQARRRYGGRTSAGGSNLEHEVLIISAARRSRALPRAAAGRGHREIPVVQ